MAGPERPSPAESVEHPLRTILSVSAALLLTACSMFGGSEKDDNVGMSYSEAMSLSKDLDPANGRIFVYRQRAALGNVVTADVDLNGEPIGDSEAGGFFYVDRAAGNYQLSARQTGAEGGSDDHKASFSLGPGQSVYVKISIGGVVT